MKNTEFNLETLSSVISAEVSLETLKDIIFDLGLEIKDIARD